MTRGDEHSEIGVPSPPSAYLRSASTVPDDRLPPSFERICVDPEVKTLAGSTSPAVLLGGSPLKLLRLNPPADAIFAALARGVTLHDAAVESNRSVRSVARFTRRLLDSGIVHPRWERRAEELDDQPIQLSRSVSIIIPVYQRSAELDRLLTSIHESLPTGIPVIVVDDGSTDDSSAVALGHGARVVRHETSRGPAAARNAGLEGVATEFVAFLDSDCLVTGRWLEPLMAHFGDPAVALVAPRIAGLAPRMGRSANLEHTSMRAYEDVRSPLDLGNREAPVVPRTRVAYVPAAALVARTAAIRDIGGFATSMHVGEDVDLLWRLHAAGHVCRYEPSSVVQHDHRTSPGAFLKRRFQYGTSAAELAKRHPGHVPPLAVSGWSALAWGLLATVNLLGLAASAAVVVGTAAALPQKLTSVAEPRKLAARLALRGHLGAGRQLASAIWRSYLPIAIACALLSKRARFTLLAAGLIPNLLDWSERHPNLDPIRYVGIRLADDAAYCAGVWHGCREGSTLAPLRPDLTSWPGRRNAAEDSIGSGGGNRRKIASWLSTSTARWK